MYNKSRKRLEKEGYRKENKENNENIKVIGYVGKRKKEVPPLDRNVPNVRVRGDPSDIVECNVIPSNSTTFCTHIQCPLSTTPLPNIRQNRSTVLSKTEAKVYKNTTNNNYLQVPLSATSRTGPVKSQDIRVDSSISRGTLVLGGNNVEKTFSRGSTNSKESQFALLPPIATNRQSSDSDIPWQKTECRFDKSISRGNNTERTFSRGTLYSRGSQFALLPPIATNRQFSGSGISWQKTECSRGHSGFTNRSPNVSASNRTVYSDLSQDISFNFTSEDESIITAENDRKTKTCNKHDGDRCNSSDTGRKHTERCKSSDIYATYTGFKGHKVKTKSPDRHGNKQANAQNDHKRKKEKIKQKEYVSSYLRINKLTSESKLDTKDQAIENHDQSRRIGSTQSRQTPLRSAGHLFKKSHMKTDRILVLEKLVDAAKSVGVICCDNIFHGTGFMVGGKYVFTAFHVIRSMLGLSNCSVYEMKDKMETLLKKKSCSVIFNLYREHEQNMEHFHIEEHVPFYDERLDIILLELKENFGIPFPVSLTNFDDLQFTDRFQLIAHPDGKPKERDADCVLLDISRDKAYEIRQSMMNYLGDEHSQTVLNTYGDPYHGIDDPDKCFFNCVFEHTASGAPGITIDQNGTVKACMVLLGGYPTFYWECPEDIKSTMPKDLRFEFGIKLSAVYASLKTHNASLCDRVFPNCPWAMFQ